jgi:integrase
MAVKLESFQGRLRLRWSCQGKRYTISLGLDDTSLGRTIAQGRVSQIETDLITGTFDVTLAKYRTGVNPPEPGTKITAVNLFDRFIEHKVQTLASGTVVKYRALAGKVRVYLGEQSAALDDRTARAFKARLQKEQAPITLKGNLSIINACWIWGIKQGLVSVNPWDEDVKRVKVPPKQTARPFTKLEITAILNGFRQGQHYRHYGDFVEFLLSTGCRTGEAIGLRWVHLSEDCGKVWIGESISRGVRKTTKTNKSREFGLTTRLTNLLRSSLMIWCFLLPRAGRSMTTTLGIGHGRQSLRMLG